MAKNPRGSATYEVGFAKPPKSGQFKPGQSGNPSGKRRGKHLSTLINEELAVTIRVPDGDKVITLSKAELVAKALVNQAVKGDLRAIDMLAGLAGGGDTDKPPVDFDGISPAMIASFLRRHRRSPQSGSGDGEETDHAE